MEINFKEFETFPVRKEITAGKDELVIDYEGFNQVLKVAVKLNIQKSAEEYYCQGEIQADVELECARCLKLFQTDVNGQTDFIVCAESTMEENKGIIDNEDYIILDGTGFTADLSPVVRQSLILAASMKPLCSENCRGLCASCGINLNNKDCACKKDVIDPRWQGLADLSTKMKKEGN